jgi:hypothetical protein
VVGGDVIPKGLKFVTLTVKNSVSFVATGSADAVLVIDRSTWPGGKVGIAVIDGTGDSVGNGVADA